MIRAAVMRWLQGPPLTGHWALLCAAAAVSLPTAVRAAVDGAVTGCEFTPYLPFVLIAALLLRWWLAAAVAISAVVILGGLFTPGFHADACFLSSAAMFLASSAAMIGIVMLIRGVISALQHRADESAGGVVFSLRDGHVWASWYGQEKTFRLGSQAKVSEMMEDFLAQEEVGRRLAASADASAGLSARRRISA